MNCNDYKSVTYLLTYLPTYLQSPADFHDTQRNDCVDKIMNPQHFESDPTDIRIQIWINLEICTRTRHHYRLRLDSSNK